MTRNNQQSVKRIKLGFSPGESVTSFGGMAVLKRTMRRVGVESLLERHLPARRGYTLPEIATSAVVGLISGARGTVATEAARHDPALRKLFGLGGSPEEATFWRALSDAGEERACEAFARVSDSLAHRAIKRSKRLSIYDSGFLPVFVDGTLLEGSPRREGTKFIREKGNGLLWTVGFVGPYPVAQRLANEGDGEGEATHARELIKQIARDVLRPCEVDGHALVLMDSLHGNGKTLDALEDEKLSYVIGARGLKAAESALAEQPECCWTPTPEFDESRTGIEDSAVCVATVQCEEWETARTIVGRRWKKKGEMIWNYSAVLTNLEANDERLKLDKKEGAFARKVWSLYNRKGACENHFKNLLEDLGLHHPPCREWQRNAGFYALGILAALIAIACDVLTSKPSKARRRIATLRRWLFAVPARVTLHARTARAEILGLSADWRRWIEERFARACRC